MHAYQIQGSWYEMPLRVLLDSGSDYSHAHSRIVPKGINPNLITPQSGITIAGVSSSNRVITLSEITFPEFSKHHVVDNHRFQLFDAPSYYDVIIGRDLLFKIGGITDFDKATMTAFGYTVAMRDKQQLDNRNQFFYNLFEDQDQYFVTKPKQNILESKYEKVDIDDVIRQQDHLDQEDKQSLRRVLEKHTHLFSGTVGRYPHKKMDLELVEGAQPVHLKAYQVPRVHQEVFKAELRRLCQIGVLSRVGSTEWAFPSFIIPKKDGRVRWISDFRKLNELIRRKQYPLPRIQDILRKRSGYSCFTKIDISMQYYTFELTERAKDLCVIVTPFGKFRYNVAPMGVKQSPDFAQEIMETVLQDEEDVEIYLDDIGIWGKSRQHIEAVESRVLTKLENNGFTVNPLKCEWRVQETDWLGHWLTPKGLKPWKKKIQPIIDMQRPTTITQVRSFVGSVNFYRDLFPRRSHILAPLAELPSKGKFQWLPEHEQAFQEMKSILCRDCMVRYPDHNIPFEIYTDASDYQLGAVIMQNGRPVAYYSRKLNPAQRNYSTMDKELLSIYETLKQYQSMLLGAVLTIHTDHKNLVSAPSTNQRVLRQLSYIEDFHPTWTHIPGNENVLADMFSRLPIRHDLDRSQVKEGSIATGSKTMYIEAQQAEGEFDAYYASCMYDHLNDKDVHDCFLNLPLEDGATAIALDYHQLAQAQLADPDLQQRRWQHPMQHPNNMLSGVHLITYKKDASTPWKICLPTQQLQQIVHWYHEALAHSGANRLFQTIDRHFCHPKLRSTIKYITSTCDACQRNSLLGKQYGHLPARVAEAMPWQEVDVDLIGPWAVNFRNDRYDFYALTCIDPATGYPEAIRLQNKTAQHVGLQFENIWVARYPRPTICRHDPGPEFKGKDFTDVLNRLGIQDKSTTVRNPQSNAICERLHQTIAKTLRILIHRRPPQNIVNIAELVDAAIATCLHSVRATVHTTTGVSPGALVFGRDMMHDIPVHPDHQQIQYRRQQMIDQNAARANSKRIDWKYQVGDEVLQIQHKPDKLDERATGPFIVTEVFQNGTITINKGNGIHLTLNSRWIRPYKRRQ